MSLARKWKNHPASLFLPCWVYALYIPQLCFLTWIFRAQQLSDAPQGGEVTESHVVSNHW
jgi:hypothetical protein